MGDRAIMNTPGLEFKYHQVAIRPDGGPGGEEVTVGRVGRPNVYHLATTSSYSYKRPEVKGNDTTWVEETSKSEKVLASDGQFRYLVSLGQSEGGANGSCSRTKVGPKNEDREIDTWNPIYWTFFDLGQWHVRSSVNGHWSTEWRMRDPGLRSLKYLGRDTALGQPVTAVEWVYTIGFNLPDDDPVFTTRLYYGDDGFIRKIVTTSDKTDDYDGRKVTETIDEIKEIAPNQADFAYQVPAGITCTDSDPEEGYHSGDYADLPMGSIAPNVTLPTARGDTMDLMSYIHQHKVTLIEFWDYG
jgi:hypothetical protein